jgi:primosomal protein N' (replication factor Y)
MTGRIASVLFPLPLPEAFDYEVPQGLSLAIGDHVVAPLGPRTTRGVVTALRDGTGGNRPLKPLISRLDDPPIPAASLEFVQWAARYSVDVPGAPLAMALRGLKAPPPKAQHIVVVTGLVPSRMTPARLKVLAAAAEQSMTIGELAASSGASTAIVRGLLDAGALALQEKPVVPWPQPDPNRSGAQLNVGQAAAASALIEKVSRQAFSVTLLDGVTGSGKTEVYLEAVAEALKADPSAQVLVLLPEIALTQAVISRLADRFGAPPGEWHSGLSLPVRRQVWEGVASGEIRVVAGARSALFLPFTNLKLVIADEEHDSSYKQEEGFIYQGRDLAVVRGQINNCPVILASATPSIETLLNAQSGRYGWVRLAGRHGSAGLPDIELVDLRLSPPESDHWLSRPLIQAVGETLARGEQALLFLNRRGYAPLVLCKACGQRMTAPDTDSWLVEHRYTNRLVCHLTGFSMPRPKHCPHCGAADSLVSIGPGVERVEEEARSLFPEARIAVFSSDRVSGPMGARTLVDAMEAGDIDILVATQAAAKGHNFPALTLVGVVDADLGLRGGDLRAGERTFQLLAQASGRAGRRDRPGRAMLQTWLPEHPVMQALKAQDRDAFVEAELEARQAAGMPPFGRLAALILSGPDLNQLQSFADTVMLAMPNVEGLEAYGPADAPLALIRGRRRKRILVRADRNIDLSGFLAAWRARFRVPGAIRLTIDMDPYSFL